MTRCQWDTNTSGQVCNSLRTAISHLIRFSIHLLLDISCCFSMQKKEFRNPSSVRSLLLPVYLSRLLFFLFLKNDSCSSLMSDPARMNNHCYRLQKSRTRNPSFLRCNPLFPTSLINSKHICIKNGVRLATLCLVEFSEFLLNPLKLNTLVLSRVFLLCTDSALSTNTPLIIWLDEIQ